MKPEERVEKFTWLSVATGISLTIPRDPNDKTPPDPYAALKADLLRENALLERADEERKQLLLAGAIRMIEPLKPKLQDAFDIGLKDEQQKSVMGIGYTSTSNKRSFQGSDLSKVADSRDINQNTKLTKKGDKKDKSGGKDEPDQGKLYMAAQHAMEVIDGIREDLENERTTRKMIDMKKPPKLVDGPPQPLFLKDEIISEVYDPLIRSGVLPDGFVANNMSRNQAMLEATNEYYKKELSDPTNSVSSGIADFSKAMIDVGSNLTTAVLKGIGHDPGNVQALLTGCTELAKASVDAVDLISDGVSGRLTKDKVQGLFNQFPDILGKFVTGFTGDATLGDAVKMGASGAITVSEGVVAAVYGEKGTSAGLFTTFIGNMIQGAVDGLNTGLKNEKVENVDALVKDFGGLVSTLGAGAVTKIGNAIQKGSLADARSGLIALADGLASQLQTVLDDSNVVAGTSKSKQGTDSVIGGDVGSGVQDLGKVLQTTSDGYEDIKGAKEKKAKEIKTAREETMKKLRAEYAEQQAKDVLAELEQQAAKEKKDIEDILQGLGKPSQDSKDIDKLMAKMQRDKAIFAVAVSIGLGAVDVASKFCSYLAVGTELIKMAMNMKKAVENAVAVLKFIDEQKSARGVNSRYGSAITNFLDNQEFQYTRNSVAAAMNGVSAICAIAASACPYAAPATPAAAALSGAIDGGFALYQATQLKKSWKVTKMALKDPQNRRLGQKARKLNPTLAKYTIAYGATEERDPIAVSMANACGLDDKTLRNPSANVDKVKKYLELKFPDDGKVKGYYKDEDGWEANLPDPAVTITAVTKLYIELNKHFGTIDRKPPSNITGLVTLVQKPLQPTDETIEKLTQRQKIAEQIDTSLREIGGNLVKQYQAIEISTVFDDFADAAGEIAFQAFIKVKEVEANAKAPNP